MTQDITPNPVGRPTVMTPETIQKLVDVFRLGVSDRAACSYAGISPVTFYGKLKEDEGFMNTIETAKHYAIIAARQVVVKSIVEDKDLNTAKWYLEKHDVKQEAPQQNTQVNVFNMLKEKYTKKEGTEGQSDQLPEVIVETHG